MSRMHLPLWLKILWTIWIIAWAPLYWRQYGAQNFLYFCDLGNFLIAVGLWLESPLIFSWQATGLLLFQTLFAADLLGAFLTGKHWIGGTEFMFDAHLPMFLRLLSLFPVVAPPLVRELQKRQHKVAVFHRGRTPASFRGVEIILGDRKNLEHYREDFQRFAPDTVIHMILSSGRHAEALMLTVRGIARRVVALSSMDVYRAFGLFHGTESGPLQPVPLTEQSEVRRNLHPYPPAVLNRVQGIFNWMDDDYDKIPVEQAVLGYQSLPGTVLRLPMVYGPGDPLHRFFPMLKRMVDRRTRILMFDEIAAWRSPRGYVENVAAAIALAACSDRAVGEIYNVAEEPAFYELEWARHMAAQAWWDGEFTVLPRERTPKHLLVPGNFRQHGIASSNKIRQELGFQEPVSIADAIRRTIAWEKENPPAEVSQEQFDYPAEDRAVAA